MFDEDDAFFGGEARDRRLDDGGTTSSSFLDGILRSPLEEEEDKEVAEILVLVLETYGLLCSCISLVLLVRVVQVPVESAMLRVEFKDLNDGGIEPSPETEVVKSC